MDTQRKPFLITPTASVAGLVVLAAIALANPARAAEADPRIAAAQANVTAYCTSLVDDATNSSQRSTRADLCAMWTRELADLAPTPSPSTPPPTTTAAPTASPTTPAPTTPPATTPPATSTPPSVFWPSRATTGVPAGWTPVETHSYDLIITTPGAIVQDVRLLDSHGIIIRADNVTVRRVELQGGDVSNYNCQSGLRVEQTSFVPPAGAARAGSPEGAITPGGYVADRVKILDYIEGVRSGDCGPITVSNSYMEINDGGNCNLHADGIQGYYGLGVIVRNSWIDARKMTCGTSPFFYPKGQGNVAPVDIDRLWLAGGGYSFRLGVGPATVRNVQILDGSWAYGAVDVYCPAVSVWDVKVVNSSGLVSRSQACTGSGT